MRRFIGAVSVAGVLAVAAFAGAATGQHQRRAAGGRPRYVDPMGWSLEYPPTMYLESSGAQLRISVAEVTVASFPPAKAVSSGSTPTSSWLRVDPPLDAQGVFPADGVAFRIVNMEGGPGPRLIFRFGSPTS